MEINNTKNANLYSTDLVNLIPTCIRYFKVTTFIKKTVLIL